MNDFNYYKSKEIYREKYYQMPKVFFTNEKYMDLSNDAKIAYMLLKDRFDYSVKNNWVDSDDNIFFIFTVEELMKLLQCREGKVSKIKKELEKAGLLKQKRGRVNKRDGKIESMPNLLYLGKPEVTNQDVFKIMEEEDNTDTTVIAKIANTAKSSHIKDSTVIAKIADNLFYSNSIDTNRHIIDTETDQLQNQVLLDNFVDIMKEDSINTFVPENVLNLIKTFSSTYEDAQKTVQTIHNAKKKAEELEQTVVVYEELESYGIDADKGLYMTLLKAYQKQKTEKVNNLQNLIFVYVKNWFVEKAIAAKLANEQRETFNELPTVSTENWLE
ncbi:replication initiator protein A [Enterococcus faecium]|uniref:replication initiator protein A n=4 Tax=Enterococcus TaxID=1350 RepID=UPI0001EB7AD3|nr:replication initiator protein A [Enterococcus faecium]EFR68041.1 replication initiator protein A domain protein [Enterococcus faecium TX0133a01]EFR78200.1 replication initiator protein A domain protein [Enterococcus faecium TX0133C]EFS08760.1 replication initiator protein A domain protein [Enterococcus faecium TX0082]EJX53241.1 replication initiator protein A [Enterococcus faecium R494]EJX66836.1 replication initiator protein A [Enterococcus faecium P1190]